VKIRIGDYAYEVIELPGHGNESTWSFSVYRLKPFEKVAAGSQNSPNRDHAERNACQLIQLYIELDRMNSAERPAKLA
jgi:hypothetical protein